MIKCFFGHARFSAAICEDDDDTEQLAYAYPGAVKDGWVAGISVRVQIDSSSWVGHFSAGRESPNALSLCCAHPDGLQIVVIAKGLGYVVSSRQPEDWQLLAMRPIMGCCPAPDEGVLVLFGFTYALGLLSDGTAWRSQELSWDGLRNVRVAAGKVLGEGWDAPTSMFVPFELDVLTGKGSGGAMPPPLREQSEQ
jgi:hypothetical protein